MASNLKKVFRDMGIDLGALVEMQESEQAEAQFCWFFWCDRQGCTGVCLSGCTLAACNSPQVCDQGQLCATNKVDHGVYEI